MALQRKPLKADLPPSYPASQEYANDRRNFLMKLGITAAGLLGLAGCGEASGVQSQTASTPTPVPTSNTTPPAKWPLTNPVEPIAAMPGAPPPPNISTTTTGNPPPISCSAPPNAAPARPEACKPGDVAPVQAQPARPAGQVKGGVSAPDPARPVAHTGGEPQAPEMIQTPAPPAKKEEK